MIKKKIVILPLLYITLCHTNPEGVIYIERYLGLLGNQLFQFCLGKILSQELGFPLKCPPIYGFPETYLHHDAQQSPDIPTQVLWGHVIKFKETLNNKTPRNIVLKGIFARYEYFENYKDKIKQWLRFDKPIIKHANPNDIVMHIRINPGTGLYLPPIYYEQALASTRFDKVYICTNEPNDPFLGNFKKYNPIIKTTMSLKQLLQQGKSYAEIIKIAIEDFKFITSFNKIITAQSTFSWWAGFLSEAEEVFAPLPNKGIMSPSRPDIQLTGIKESRYKYIRCNF